MRKSTKAAISVEASYVMPFVSIVIISFTLYVFSLFDKTVDRMRQLENLQIGQTQIFFGLDEDVWKDRGRMSIVEEVNLECVAMDVAEGIKQIIKNE